jgi:hypothetical protein
MSNARNLANLLGTNTTLPSSSIADSSITAAKIATGSVNTSHIASDAITTAKVASDAITTAKISSDAVTTAKIASDAVTHTKIHALGSMLYEWDNSVFSAAATGYRTMSNTFTLPSDSNLADGWANMCSLTFFGYISSGSYYYTWRLFDVTDNSVVQPITGPSSYRWWGASGAGGFQWTGSVHANSNQAARVFDVTGRGGNGITLEMSAANGQGSVLYTNASQTLYADQIFLYAGAMTGMHNENGY